MITTLNPFSRVARVTSELPVGFSCPESKDPAIKIAAQKLSERTKIVPLCETAN
jgi:hypothetical protein